MRRFLPGTALVVTLLFAFQFSSCTKDDVTPPADTSIYGLWTGTYTIDGYSGAGAYFSLILKPDGTMINDTKTLDGQQDLNIGTWTLTGDQLKCHITCVYGAASDIGVQEDFTATFNKAAGTITNGIWENTPPRDGSGTFGVEKVN